MKKNKFLVLNLRYLEKLWLTMKICLFVLLITTATVSASISYSQNTKLTLNLQNATIQQLIQEIEKQSEFIFVFYDNALDLKQKVSIKVENLPVEKILEKVLETTGNSFAVFDRQIVIGKKNPETGAFKEPLPVEQKKEITGKVIDKQNMPVPGASVVIKGTTTGIITDANGSFKLGYLGEAKVLVFSFVGMKTQEIQVGNRTDFTVVMEEETVSLEEVVAVGYGVQKKESVTAAISTVSTKELRRSSTPNLSTALAGQLPGLTVMQTSGQPGADVANLYLRGVSTLNNSSPLILIDGVPRTGIDKLDPNEVASISILKDASATAVFGVRGANGVIIITTRRGDEGKSELNITVDKSFQQFLAHNDRIHSWDFAELRNQAFRNSNPNAKDSELPFTQYMIDKYRSGEDQIFYPDRDVYHDYFRDWAPQTRVNANFNGGGKGFTYFLNAGYIGQGGNFKTEPESFLGYDPSYKMDRYNFRGNIDYKIAPNLKASLNLATYLQQMNSPQTVDLFNGDMNSMVTNMIAYTWGTPPTDPGPTTVAGYGVPENEIVAQSGQDRNTYGEINRRGYRQEYSTVLNSSLVLDWGLDFITKGLSAKGLVAFDSNASTVRQGARSLNTYAFSVARDESQISKYTVIRDNQDKAIRLSKSMSTYYFMNYQLSLNYARKFGRHNVTGMFLYQRDNWDKWAADLPYNVIGYVGRLTYDYDNRYLGEINFGYNGSEQFAPKNRFGAFPAFSLGWVASNESFLKDNPVLTYLKLRASYGISGNDKLGESRFLYQSFINMDAGEIPGLGLGKKVVQGRIGNESLQWEKSEKKNIGVDLKVFNGLSLTVDVFNEHRDQILISRSTIPVLQGVPISNIPKVNIGIVDNHGYELELGYQKIINNELSFNLRGNFTYNKNTVKFSDEVKYGEDYAYRYRQTGYSIGQKWGYQIDYSNGNGYINTADELANLPAYEVGGTPRLGDFKYVDVNKDGKINDRDLIPMGYPAVPRITYGLSGNLKYKNFDFAFVFSGIARSSVNYNGWGVTEFGLVGFFSKWHFNAWTPERYANNEKILYPALGMAAGTSQKANNFFIMDRSFLRLKNLEIGYNIPKSILKPIGIENVRVYANGNNLFTWDKLPVNTIDPEQDESLKYPLTKMVTVGVNLTF